MSIKVCDSIMGTGKAQPLSAQVLTDTGFRDMGSIAVGDRVYGEDGNLHNVIGVYPQGKKDVYRVTFSDRTSTECCEEHLWTYQFPQDKANGVWRTSSLSEIMRDDLFKSTNRGDKNWQYFIPITSPIQFPKKKLLIDPYVLGALLGDGCLLGTVTLTNSERDVVKRVTERLPSGYVLNKINQPDGHADTYLVTPPERRPNDKHYIIEALRSYNLMDGGSYDKFIPSDYLLSSIEDRVELIRGLIDTDGCTSGGKLSFSSTSIQLAKGVQYLVQSLGGTGTLSTKSSPFYIKDGERVYCHECYNVYIRMPNLPIACTSSKHLLNLNAAATNTGVCRSIRKIERVSQEECQCILVDNPSHLYLTNDFIVTHNTSAAIRYMNENPDKRFIFITPYLTETERIRKECAKLNFIEPSDRLREYGFKKSLHTMALIERGENISTTHQAFKGYTQDTLDHIREKGYTLIIDENVEILETFEYHPADLQLAIDAGYIKEENGVYTLVKDGYSGTALREMMYLLKSRELIKVTERDKDPLFFWALPPNLLTSFTDVFILTYLFPGQSIKYFMDIYNIKYEFIGIERTEDGGYTFGDYPGYTPGYVSELRSKLNILDNPKMNSIGDGYYDLSMSWYSKHEDEVAQLKRNIHNYYNNIYRDVPSDRRMWGSYKGEMCKVKGKGYTKAFVTFNAKATNQYKNRDCLVYVANLFMNVNEKKFYNLHGIEVDEDMYALSIMVQWIWRSAIRDGNEVYLYIPSRRMRELLIGWIDSVSKGGNHREEV